MQAELYSVIGRDGTVVNPVDVGYLVASVGIYDEEGG